VVEQTNVARSEQREQFWQRVVAKQPGSGSSVVAWCRQHGVSVASFYAWRKRLLLRDAQRQSRQPQLLPLQIIPAVADDHVTALEICLPRGVKVRVRSGCAPELVRQVLTMLRQDRREEEAC
jgi:transposase-like protein